MNLDLFNDGMSTYTGERDALDRYYTPAELVDALMSRIDPLIGHGCRYRGRAHSVLEPCAGRALSIANAVSDWGDHHHVTTGDLDAGADVDVHADATRFDWRGPPRPVGHGSGHRHASRQLPRGRWLGR